MKLHAIQTGSVRIKTAQVEGRGRGLRRRLAIFADRDWTEWLPTYAWVIEHPEGIIVVDTGQGTHLLDSAKSLHPYIRWETAFRIERDEEIGPQLRALGIGPRDVKRVILTHLHVDHDGGLAHFPKTEILVARGELPNGQRIDGSHARLSAESLAVLVCSGPADLEDEAFGPFGSSKRLTDAGDVVAVATPGHTADHVSVLVECGGTMYFLAGDTSYDERLMLAGQIDGVSADDDIASATLDAIKRLAYTRPTVYLPTHDPRSAIRLATRCLVEHPEAQIAKGSDATRSVAAL